MIQGFILATVPNGRPALIVAAHITDIVFLDASHTLIGQVGVEEGIKVEASFDDVTSALLSLVETGNPLKVEDIR